MGWVAWELPGSRGKAWRFSQMEGVFQQTCLLRKIVVGWWLERGQSPW
jgi:hypothetical protein